MPQLTINDYTFQCDVASTPDELTSGLSFITSIPYDYGLLFDFLMEKPIVMWMKDVSFPLDMIFISEEGEVVHIEEFCEPDSEELISSELPARYCLEINAGMCDAVGIDVGSIVEYEE